VSARIDRRLIAGLLAAVVLSACGAAAAGAGSGAVPTATASVVRTDIVSRQQLPGTLTYAGTYSIINPACPGVFTRIPADGSVVNRGQTLYWVNSRPIPLLYGDPQWRPLSLGVADGADIRGLQANLVALGFGPGLRVDNHFDWVTAAAVRRWQTSLGVPATGAVMPGDAVYAAGPIRISAVHISAGSPAQPGQPVLDATSPQRAVLLPIDVTRQSLIRLGESVTVALPNGTNAQGTVSTIGAVAVAQQNGNSGSNGGPPSASITVTISLNDPAAGGALDQAPVEVAVTYDTHKNVLAVPVTALLAEPGGTYAVQVVDGSQRHRVTVTTGLFDDRGLVEVSSAGLREGMLVEVPRP
jgi:peptidoglycan hydrolase-like protein with peptidoglycan-binding domain